MTNKKFCFLIFPCNVSQDAVVRPWRAGAEPLQSGGPTLLHLAAGLGYSRLACALLHWRAENPSSVLDAEVDALRQDSAGLTPLAWACAAGHADTARILYRFVQQSDLFALDLTFTLTLFNE